MVNHKKTDLYKFRITGGALVKKPNFKNFEKKFGCSQFIGNTYEMIKEPYINEFSIENHSRAEGEHRAIIDLIEYLDEGIANADDISNELTIGKSRVFEFDNLIKDFIKNWDEFPDYHYLVPNLEKYFGILIENGIISPRFMPRGGAFIEKPNFENIGCSEFKGKTYEMIENHYIGEFSKENHAGAQGDLVGLIDLIEYIKETIYQLAVKARNSNPRLEKEFEFNSLIKDFIDNWDIPGFENYHYLIPNLEKYFGILIEKKIISPKFMPIMPNGGGFYSNIICPKSGISYNINSKKGRNIIYKYLQKVTA